MDGVITGYLLQVKKRCQPGHLAEYLVAQAHAVGVSKMPPIAAQQGLALLHIGWAHLRKMPMLRVPALQLGAAVMHHAVGKIRGVNFACFRVVDDKGNSAVGLPMSGTQRSVKCQQLVEPADIKGQLVLTGLFAPPCPPDG
jgi:hypothetical protein